MLSFGVLIAFLSPKQSEIEESSLESISKSIIQGVWDPAHSTRTGIIAHSTRVGIPSGYRHHSIRMSHIWNSIVAAIPSGCLTFGILTSDGRGEHFNFPGQTYPDPLIALTRRPTDIFRYFSAQCCGVLLKLPDMCDRHLEIFCFRYLMSKSPNSPCNPPIIGFLSY